MHEKKLVYNGYEERYVSGKELKQLFVDQYYTTGRHHSVILGIAISDYLDLLGINDTMRYRIFINEYFCRIMREDTDKLVSFFGHKSLEEVDLLVNPYRYSFEKSMSCV